MLPSALDRWDEIAARLDGRRLALFLDYDGTLSPIAPRPELAVLPEQTRDVLRRLAERFPVVIVSGRGREDVASLVGLDGLAYAGSHGFDIAGPSLRLEVGEGIPEKIERASERLRRDLGGIPGVLVEPKRFAVSVHFRLADERDVPRIERAVNEAIAATPGLRKAHGKKLFEIRPDLDWDKGRAVLWLLDALDLDQPEILPFYIGDDLTDEDAFRAVADRGIGILVAEEPRETAARYGLQSPEEARELLERLAE
jgi:trehalose 6-phosphate phosphatase